MSERENPACFGVNPHPLDAGCLACTLRAKCFYQFNQHSRIKLRTWKQLPDDPPIRVEKRPVLYAGVPSIDTYWSGVFADLRELGLARSTRRVTKKGRPSKSGGYTWEIWSLRTPTESWDVLAIERADTRLIRVRVFMVDEPTKKAFPGLQRIKGTTQYRLIIEPDDAEMVSRLARFLLDRLYCIPTEF